MIHPVDPILMGVLLLVNLCVGIYFTFFRCGNRVVTTKELFLGSRTLQMVPLALSIMASTVSGLSFIGFAAHFYAYGLHISWSIASFLLYMPFLVHLVVPTLYNLQLSSVFEVKRDGLGLENRDRCFSCTRV